MTDMTISPVQTQGITGQDAAITIGAAALGALGGGSMYFKTPSEDSFVKSGVKFENKALAEQAETLTNALKEANDIDSAKAAAQKAVTEAAEGEAKTAAQKALEEANAKTLSKETQEALGKLGLAEDAKNAGGITDKLKSTVSQISDEKIFTKAKTAANEVLADGAKFADDAKAAAKDALEGKVKGFYETAKTALKDGTDKLAGEAKTNAEKALEVMKKAKMSAALKWGAIAAGAAALVAAAYCYLSKGNNAQAEQQPTEQA